MIELDATTAIELTIRIVCIGAVVDGFEKLGNWHWLPKHRDVGRISRRRPPSARERLMAVVLGGPHMFPRMWLVRTLVSAALVYAPLNPWLTSLGLPWLFLSGALYIVRTFPFGTSGADRMMALIFGALCLWRLDWQDETVSSALLIFLAVQACLSYVTAGWSRLHLPAWRNGTAVGRYWSLPDMAAPEGLGQWLEQRRALNRALTWGALVVECSFPFVLVGPPWLSAIYLLWGVTFHLVNALVIGLSVFVWAWLALYPAIIWFIVR